MYKRQGGKLDSSSTAVEGCFTLIRTGVIPESRSNKSMPFALVRKGNTDILLNAERYAYTDPRQFEALDIDLEAVSYTHLDVYKRQQL